MEENKRPTGMFGFSIVWLGQIVSVLASSMTGFGMTLWMYQANRKCHRDGFDAGGLYHPVFAAFPHCWGHG